MEAFWLALLLLIIAVGHAQSFLVIRPVAATHFDSLMRYSTYVGDGIFALGVVVLLLLFRRFAFAFVVLAGYSISGLLAQVLKALISSFRPAPYFENLGRNIHAVDGVALLQSHNSMPSGHTATAFALATALVLMSSWWSKRSWLAALLAIIIGYSRIFLGQHFPADVLVGSVLGVCSSLLGMYIWNRWNPAFGKKQSGSFSDETL